MFTRLPDSGRENANSFGCNTVNSHVGKSLKNYLQTGWTLKYHLHNHYEPKENEYVGILAPSITNAQYYLFLSEEFSLNNAIITYGFNTVEITREEFQKLKTPENN